MSQMTRILLMLITVAVAACSVNPAQIDEMTVAVLAPDDPSNAGNAIYHKRVRVGGVKVKQPQSELGVVWPVDESNFRQALSKSLQNAGLLADESSSGSYRLNVTIREAYLRDFAGLLAPYYGVVYEFTDSQTEKRLYSFMVQSFHRPKFQFKGGLAQAQENNGIGIRLNFEWFIRTITSAQWEQRLENKPAEITDLGRIQVTSGVHDRVYYPKLFFPSILVFDFPEQTESMDSGTYFYQRWGKLVRGMSIEDAIELVPDCAPTIMAPPDGVHSLSTKSNPLQNLDLPGTTQYPRTCSFQFDRSGRLMKWRSCDVDEAKACGEEFF